ncbi:FAD-dependent oxidoreductase [Sinorhizobium meliloti]|nr:FAD-dependent oxidoreductase [Sinorhizobium meliloti]
MLDSFRNSSLTLGSGSLPSQISSAFWFSTTPLLSIEPWPPAARKVFRAKRLPINTGVSAWVAMLPPRNERESLSADVKADVVIVGAGFAGLAAARRLSQLAPDVRVVVLEAGVIGEGAAGRNSGFIIDLPHDVSSDDSGGDGENRSARALVKGKPSSISPGGRRTALFVQWLATQLWPCLPSALLSSWDRLPPAQA